MRKYFLLYIWSEFVTAWMYLQCRYSLLRSCFLNKKRAILDLISESWASLYKSYGFDAFNYEL